MLLYGCSFLCGSDPGPVFFREYSDQTNCKKGKGWDGGGPPVLQPHYKEIEGPREG